MTETNRKKIFNIIQTIFAVFLFVLFVNCLVNAVVFNYDYSSLEYLFVQNLMLGFAMLSSFLLCLFISTIFSMFNEKGRPITLILSFASFIVSIAFLIFVLKDTFAYDTSSITLATLKAYAVASIEPFTFVTIFCLVVFIANLWFFIALRKEKKANACIEAQKLNDIEKVSVDNDTQLDIDTKRNTRKHVTAFVASIAVLIVSLFSSIYFPVRYGYNIDCNITTPSQADANYDLLIENNSKFDLNIFIRYSYTNYFSESLIISTTTISVGAGESIPWNMTYDSFVELKEVFIGIDHSDLNPVYIIGYVLIPIVLVSAYVVAYSTVNLVKNKRQGKTLAQKTISEN